MPVEFQVDEERELIIATCVGVLTVEDARAGVATLWELPRPEGRSVIWDFRDAQLDIDAADPRDLAKFVLKNQPSPPPSRVAFVTPTDLQYGLARMFEAYRQDPDTEFGVFRDYEEACEWAQNG
jgi:hypothetical protein